MNKKIFLIKSKDRKTGTSSNFYIKSQDLIDGVFTVVNILIPNSTYNITADNGKFTLWESAPVNEFPLVIPPGSYTSLEFANTVKALVNSVGVQNFDVTVSPITGKLTAFTTTAGNPPFYFVFPNEATSQLFGFGTAPNTPVTWKFISPDIVNLGHPESVGVKIKEIKCSNGEYENISTMATASLYVPFNESFGFYKSLPSTELEQTVSFNRAAGLTIQLVDTSTNKEIQLNGSNWEILLMQK